MSLPCGCPEDFPQWDGQDIELGSEPVFDFPIPTFLHMPMGYEVYLGRVRHLIKQLELKERWPGFYLTRTGWMRGQILAPLQQGDSPSRHVVHLPSPFKLRVKLHKGDVGSIKMSVREIRSALLDRGCMPKELYLSHLTCPNCAEQRGGAMIMLLWRWEESGQLSRRLKKQQLITKTGRQRTG